MLCIFFINRNNNMFDGQKKTLWCLVSTISNNSTTLIFCNYNLFKHVYIVCTIPYMPYMPSSGMRLYTTLAIAWPREKTRRAEASYTSTWPLLNSASTEMNDWRWIATMRHIGGGTNSILGTTSWTHVSLSTRLSVFMPNLHLALKMIRVSSQWLEYLAND